MKSVVFVGLLAALVVACGGRIEGTDPRGSVAHECAITSGSVLTSDDVGCPCSVMPSPAYQCGARGMVLACISYEVREVPRESLVSEDFACPEDVR